MKLNIPTAKEMVNKTVKHKKEKSVSMEKVVEHFINTKILVDLQRANDSNGINTQIPSEAYDDLPEFYRLCSIEMGKLGYTTEQSHDGGGLYNTLCVTW